MRDNVLTEVTHLFLLKGKWQQKFLSSHLKETLKYIEVFFKNFVSVLLWEILSPE